MNKRLKKNEPCASRKIVQKAFNLNFDSDILANAFSPIEKDEKSNSDMN